MIDARPHETTQAAPRRRHGWLRFAIAVVFVSLVVWSVWRLGPREVLAVARQADAGWLALSLVPLVLRFLIWGVKWDRILCRRTPVSYGVALRTLFAGAFVNLTTPTAKLGGGVLRAILLHRRYGWGAAASYGRALVDQITTTLGSFALFGVLAVVVSLGTPDVPLRLPFLVTGALILAVIGTGLALRPRAWAWVRTPEVAQSARRWVPARLLRLDPDRPVEDAIHDVAWPLLGEGGTLRTLGSDIALGALSFGSLCVANALVLRSLGADVDLWLIAIAVILGYFAGTILGTWGGVGVTEASLTALYMRIGIPPETATASALLHRTTFYALVLLVGGLCWALEDRLIRRKAP